MEALVIRQPFDMIESYAAFPRPETRDPVNTAMISQPATAGMTLLEYFVGQALIGLRTRLDPVSHDSAVIARYAIEDAHRVIEELKKPWVAMPPL